MAKKHTQSVQSTMASDVHEAHQSSDFRSRWMVDISTGDVIPRATASMDSSLPRLDVQKQDDGTLSIRIPELAVGSAGYPRIMPEIMRDMDDFGDWDNPVGGYGYHRNADGKQKLREAIYWWKKDPLVYKCTKMLVQLSNTRINFTSEDDTAKETVQLWFNQAMPDSFKKQWFLEYFRTGMVPTLKTLIPYQPRAYKSNKIPITGPKGIVEDRFHAKASVEELPPDRIEATEALLERNQKAEQEYREALTVYEAAQANVGTNIAPKPQRLAILAEAAAVKQYKWLRGMVPGKYTLLDPLRVDIKGPPEMSWLREPYLQVSGELSTAVRNPSPIQQNILGKMPAEIVNQIRNGSAEVWLSPNIVNLSFGDKQDYERYPTPIGSHCFDALKMKKAMQDMDWMTIQGVKQRILLVKIGNDEYPVTDDTVISRVATIFQNIGRTGHFFWSHAITMEWIEPKVDSLKDANKYNHWNNEIRSAFGISQVLTGTSETAGVIGSSIMNFKGVEEEVAEAQAAFMEFAQEEVKRLRAALSISVDVLVEFDTLNLKDEVKFWAVIMQAVQNGIIDHETALETLGFNFPQIRKRMLSLMADKKKGLWSPTPSANNLGPGGAPIPGKTGVAGQNKKGGKGGISTGGKPAGSPGADNNANKRGTSQPKKVSARLRTVNKSVAMILDNEVDPDQLSEISSTFNHPKDWIFTEASFKEKFPDFKDIEPWPELSTIETMNAAVAAAKLVRRTEEEYEKAAATFKAEHAEEGKRGAYLTPAKKQELKTIARIEVDFAHLKDVTKLGEIPEFISNTWNEHLTQAKAAVKDSVPEDEVDSYAWALTVARLRKSMP